MQALSRIVSTYSTLILLLICNKKLKFRDLACNIIVLFSKASKYKCKTKDKSGKGGFCNSCTRKPIQSLTAGPDLVVGNRGWLADTGTNLKLISPLVKQSINDRVFGLRFWGREC